MKTTLLAILFLTSLTIAFSAELLFFESFSSGMPADWDTQGPESWHINASGYAFDDSPELMLDPEPGTGIRRFISPPINTIHYNELQFIFWHFLLAHPSNTNPFTISIQVTSNGIDWTTLWETTTTVDIPQELNSVIISRTYLNTANFQISFACTVSYAYEFYHINIYNSIFWNPYITNEVSFVDVFSGVRTANFYYCDVNSAKVTGTTPNFTDCIDADPLFRGLEDCHLLGTSP